jgi:HlyD family secretion protein
LYVTDNQDVKADNYLGVIDNSAQTADMLCLKCYLDSFNPEQILSLPFPDKNWRLGALQNLYTSFYASLFDYKEYGCQRLLSQENMQSSLDNMRIQIDQLKESLFDAAYQDTEKSNSLRSQLQSLFSQLKTEIRNWELNYALLAPIDGKITFSNYWVENQNISAGEEVFNIIPRNLKGRIIGKAMLPIARSGKVKTRQKVHIRLENFPDNEYGILQGIVRNISLVPTQTGSTANYTLEIDLPDGLLTTYKKELSYLPNMQG